MNNESLEEEYFLTSDGDGHKYIIPVSKRSKWNALCRLIEFYPDDTFATYESMNEEFGEYRVEGDWEKTFKITKR